MSDKWLHQDISVCIHNPNSKTASRQFGISFQDHKTNFAKPMQFLNWTISQSGINNQQKLVSRESQKSATYQGRHTFPMEGTWNYCWELPLPTVPLRAKVVMRWWSNNRCWQAKPIQLGFFFFVLRVSPPTFGSLDTTALWQSVSVFGKSRKERQAGRWSTNDNEDENEGDAVTQANIHSRFVPCDYVYQHQNRWSLEMM